MSSRLNSPSVKRCDMKKHTRLLYYLSACREGIDWARKYDDGESAWNACENPSWMIWLLGKLKYSDNKTIRMYACWCVRHTPLSDGRTVWDLLGPKHKNVLDLAELYADGDTTKKDLMDALYNTRTTLRPYSELAIDVANSAAISAAIAAQSNDPVCFSSEIAALDAAYAARCSCVDDYPALAERSARDHQAKRLRELVPYSVVSGLIDVLTNLTNRMVPCPK